MCQSQLSKIFTRKILSINFNKKMIPPHKSRKISQNLSSADNLFKQFRPRSDPTYCRTCSGSKLFETDGTSERNFQKVDLKKISTQQKRIKN